MPVRLLLKSIAGDIFHIENVASGIILLEKLPERSFLSQYNWWDFSYKKSVSSLTIESTFVFFSIDNDTLIMKKYLPLDVAFYRKEFPVRFFLIEKLHQWYFSDRRVYSVRFSLIEKYDCWEFICKFLSPVDSSYRKVYRMRRFSQKCITS